MGRFAVLEVMPFTDELRQMVLQQRSADELRSVAVAQGMRTMRWDGLEKVALGMTTLEELFRVVA